MQSRNLIAALVVLLATMANADILIDVGEATTDFVTVVGKAKDGYIPIPIDCDVKTGPKGAGYDFCVNECKHLMRRSGDACSESRCLTTLGWHADVGHCWCACWPAVSATGVTTSRKSKHRHSSNVEAEQLLLSGGHQ